ncbi:hypothetical protein PT974_07948 [Cladobotryum mycophilum]|uniref:Uncharacterized protein n=1 Tax=Cladobotryum mycophilum TaxID=491253 RepID=A0ABR0SBY4_9HYPO
MTRGRFPSTYGLSQIVARTLGWMTGVATICILAFIINRWPDKGGAVAAGLVGACIAVLNDSWFAISTFDRNLGFARMSPARAFLHDLFSLAISLGGIVMIIFSRYTYGIDGFALATGSEVRSSTDEISRDGFSLHKMLAISVWIITAVV